MTDESLAERVAAVVAAHPDVAGLHGGAYQALATYLPGRRLVGVRVGEAGEPVEVGVVLRLHRPIPDAVASLRTALASVCGDRQLDIDVYDVEAVPQ